MKAETKSNIAVVGAVVGLGALQGLGIVSFSLAIAESQSIRNDKFSQQQFRFDEIGIKFIDTSTSKIHSFELKKPENLLLAKEFLEREGYTNVVIMRTDGESSIHMMAHTPSAKSAE